VIGASEARAAAERELGGALATVDSRLTAVSGGAAGEPVLVHDLSLQPSYWLVPLMGADRVVGFVRVLPTGRVAAVGSFCRNPARVEECPPVVTGITVQEAAHRAADRVDVNAGEAAYPPVFVHDGPPGREAWLVRVRGKGPLERWIFVSPGVTYERTAGKTRDLDLE